VKCTAVGTAVGKRCCHILAELSAQQPAAGAVNTVCRDRELAHRTAAVHQVPYSTLADMQLLQQLACTTAVEQSRTERYRRVLGQSVGIFASNTSTTTTVTAAGVVQ
jgi:hypothetical protein